MNIQLTNIKDIIPNKDNPRIIKDEKFKKLVKSIKNFPKMLEIRPIVIDDNGIILGGNMRYKACQEIGLKEIPTIKASDLTEQERKEFILKDNNSFGDWDKSLLSSWDKETLMDSGFEEFDMIDIFGENSMTEGFKKAIEGSNFNDEEVNVDDYIKQNILFFNEMMIEFIDDDIKNSIKKINKINDKNNFIDDIKKIILKYG